MAALSGWTTRLIGAFFHFMDLEVLAVQIGARSAFLLFAFCCEFSRALSVRRPVPGSSLHILYSLVRLAALSSE